MRKLAGLSWLCASVWLPLAGAAIFVAAGALCGEKADGAPPVRADPMEWTPPKGNPEIPKLAPFDRSAQSSARARLNFLLEDRNEMPEFGIEVTEVIPESPAEKLGLEKGDILFKLDETPLVRATDFKRLRAEKTEKPATLAYYSSKTGNKKIEIAPGVLGVNMRDFVRDNPVGFTGNWADPRWRDEVRVASFLYESSPELAEAALAKAVAAGMEQNAAVNRHLALLSMAQFQYDDAMAFAYAAVKQSPDDAWSKNIFILASASNYKLEALVDFLKAHPELPENKVRDTLERLVAAHKVLPESKRVCLSPRAAAKQLFKDDLTLRAEVLPGWEGADPKTDKEGPKKDDTEQAKKEEEAKWELAPETNLDGMLVTHRFKIQAPPAHYRFYGFKPAVKNIYVRCRFTVALTDKTDKNPFTNLFRIALFPFDEKAGPALEDQASMLAGLGLAVTPGSATCLMQDHFVDFFKYDVPNFAQKLNSAVNKNSANQELILVVVDGNVEMYCNGYRIFYGPLGVPDDARLFVSFNAVGTTVSIQKFDAFELLTAEERDAKVKPEINTGYRNGMTRMHMAALHDETAYIDTLLKLGAKLDVKDDDGLTPLELAVLVNQNGSLKDFASPVSLRAACAMFDEKFALQLIKAAPPPLPPKDERISALHFAARSDNYAVVNALLEKGYDINAPSQARYKGATPLHWAIWHHRVEMATLLLSKGADPSIKDGKGHTALDVAKWMNFAAAVKLLEDWEKGVKRPFVDRHPKQPSNEAVKPPRPPDDLF